MADEKLLTIPGQGVGPMGERGTITATLRDATANPGPLGLMAFGMTTLLLNIHNAGIYEMNTMILAMGVFYGGIAQVIAGIMEWKKNSTFGMTAFLSYGLFWLTLVGLIAFPKWMGVDAPSENAMGYYLMAWGVFTGLMFVATLRINRSLQAVFLSPHHPVRAARLPRLGRRRRQCRDLPRRVRRDVGQDRRLGGHLRGLHRDLRIDRAGLERALRAHRPAAGAVPQEVGVRVYHSIAASAAFSQRSSETIVVTEGS